MTLEQMQRLWMQERFARGFENYLKKRRGAYRSNAQYLPALQAVAD